jgi:hypothetical protein
MYNIKKINEKKKLKKSLFNFKKRTFLYFLKNNSFFIFLKYK